MRDTVAKMAELKFEAPLARFEEAEDWVDPKAREDALNLNTIANNSDLVLDNSGASTNPRPQDPVDNFQETFSGSLEDLVNTFDDKITKCFCNYDESVEKLAPVQVRTQEEIMNECQWVHFFVGIGG